MAAINRDELKFRTDLVREVASLGGKIDVLTAKNEQVLELQTMVKEHDRQIHTWKGVNGTLGGGFALVLSVAASLYAKYKHWF